ncbi:MAG: small subunit ribosomal protein [Actinomycetota bacterium]|nr:small subunit ribosomal protein [Actinomycetota bacterium]
MRPYEVMVILNATLEEDAIRAQIDRAQEIIRTNGGTPNRVDRWGKRRFAYEVKHQWEGYYVLIEATSEPVAMAELDRALHLADDVVRHKVIRLPEKVAGTVPRPSPSQEGEASERAPRSDET